MTSLPIVDPDRTHASDPRGRSARRWAIPVHLCRVGLFIIILLMIRQKHLEILASTSVHEQLDRVVLNEFADSMPQAIELKPLEPNSQTREFINSDGHSIGRLLQTSPQSDSIVGYIGPTNLAIAIGNDGGITKVKILQSADTVEHVDAIRESELFLSEFVGLDWQQPALWPDIDVVSGATLSSYAVTQSVAARAGGDVRPLKFPDPIDESEISELFGLDAKRKDRNLSNVFVPVSSKTDKGDELVGYVARSSPHSDALPGYQGPTDTLVAFDMSERITSLRVRSSFDNEPYVSYVKEDRYLETLLMGKTLQEVSTFEGALYEGVSGATMTSVNVLDGIKAIAKADEELRSKQLSRPANTLNNYLIPWRDVGSVLICLFGVLMGLTKLRAYKRLRTGYLILVLVYLGFISGDILSAALVVGWSQNGMPYTVAPALILLVAAAFTVPVFSKHNVYCSHICPFGAAQQLAMNRVGKKVRLGKRLSHWLKLVPVLLLAVVLLTALKILDLNLASLEAFDAFAFQVAGWATISIAVGGLVASLFVPMAYCRFGCPTGAALDFLRFNSRSDKIGIRDGVAICALLFSIAV